MSSSEPASAASAVAGDRVVPGRCHECRVQRAMLVHVRGGKAYEEKEVVA